MQDDAESDNNDDALQMQCARDKAERQGDCLPEPEELVQYIELLGVRELLVYFILVEGLLL